MYWHCGKTFKKAGRCVWPFSVSGQGHSGPPGQAEAIDNPDDNQEDQRLKHPRDNGFAERRTAAADAKRQLLAKFASAPKPTDPEMREKLAAREAVSLAREARRAEREAQKAAERERELAEVAALAAAAEAEERAGAEARQAEVADRVARVIADEAARKAERDRRYAARKARQSKN